MMDTDEDSTKREILLAVYEGQRTESLQHRGSIFNAYSLAMAGLLALLAAVMAVNEIEQYSKFVASGAVMLATISIISFIFRQRSESENAMEIVRKIEVELRLFDRGLLSNNDVLLPSRWRNTPSCKIFKTADLLLHMLPLVILTIAICVALFRAKDKQSGEGPPGAGQMGSPPASIQKSE